MILMVSGRCDIVAFYTKWFINRYKEGFLHVRNPFYPKMVSEIHFIDVDLILFCTKNPIPIIPYLKDIKIPIIFHITLTPYLKDIEPNVIDKRKIIDAIKEISNILGKDNVVVRYDPIFISKKYTLNYHIKAFSKLCSILDGFVSRIIVSFIDDYKNVRKNKYTIGDLPFKDGDFKVIGENFASVASLHNITVQTCFEENNLCEYGFINSCCLSDQEAYIKTGKKFKKWSSRDCGCVEMVDIGAYNTCSHFCKYCYANYNEEEVKENILKHDDNSTMLIGKLSKEDKVVRRK